MARHTSDGWLICEGKYSRHEKKIGFYTIIVLKDGKWVIHDDGEDSLFSVVISKSLEDAKAESEAFLKDFCEANAKVFAPVLLWTKKANTPEDEDELWAASVSGWSAKVYSLNLVPPIRYKWMVFHKDFPDEKMYSSPVGTRGFDSSSEAKSSLEKALRAMGILFKTEEEASKESLSRRKFSRREAIQLMQRTFPIPEEY